MKALDRGLAISEAKALGLTEYEATRAVDDYMSKLPDVCEVCAVEIDYGYDYCDECWEKEVGKINKIKNG